MSATLAIAKRCDLASTRDDFILQSWGKAVSAVCFLCAEKDIELGGRRDRAVDSDFVAGASTGEGQVTGLLMYNSK